MNRPHSDDLLGVLARELSVSVGDLTAEQRLREDLGLDSIIALNLIFSFERDFGVTISESDIVNLNTVADLTALLSRLTQRSE
jgi:acyl carrier protein